VKVNDALKLIAVLAVLFYGVIIPFCLFVAWLISGQGYTWTDIGTVYLVVTGLMAFAGLVAAVLIYVLNRI
jgi:hypothetical protein